MVMAGAGMAVKRPVTSAHIGDQLKLIDAAIAQLEAEANQASLPAVSGDKNAVQELALINQRIASAKADRLIFLRAGNSAREREEQAAWEQAETGRKRHLQEAKGHAAELVGLCEKAGQLAGEFAKVMQDISATERNLHASYRAAGQSPEAAIVGQTGLRSFAVAEMHAVISGNQFRSDAVPPIATIAQRAWADLLEEKAS